MQIILTEEEYYTLKSQADKYCITSKDHIALLNKYHNLKDKYDKLLVFGVSHKNEQLKQQN